MGGGKTKTVYRTQSTPNDYDDAWIRSKFAQLDQQALGFSNWQAGRQASLGHEADVRRANQQALGQLSGDYRVQQEQLKQLQQGQSGLTADFRGLSASDAAQAKDLFNLAQAGKGVTGVKSAQGMTFTKPVVGTKALTRNALQTSSLNV